MKEVIKKYTNGEVTVVWQPAKCIHSTNCFRGLPEVFDPAKRPWVNAQGASTERIIAQVKDCPSAALSYYMNGEEDKQTETQAEAVASETLIEALANGPLLVTGNLKVKNRDGSFTAKRQTTAFCRCGASSDKPYCDGSHLRIGFKDE
jgi:uncharacterized Fe-S cluster protein YjdI